MSKIKIQILGPNCPSCLKLAELTETAARQAGLDYDLEKVTDMAEIEAHGLKTAPGLVVDGELKLAGRVASVAELIELLG